jgi:hypothetical protein
MPPGWAENSIERRARRLAIGARLALAIAFAAGAAGAVAPSPARADVFTDISPPTIAGTAVEGDTLTEAHGVWSSPPSGYTVQWQRCNSSGNDCESIPKATKQTYRLTAEDVGFTIRASESASNASGAVTPALSDPTAVVQSSSAGGQGGGPTGGGSEKGACCGRHAPTGGSAQIRALLARQLVPSGRTASLAALLKHGGVRMSFALPKAGTLSVQWYLASAKLAGKANSRSRLVATGRAVLAANKVAKVEIRLTARGKKLLRHAEKLHLEARGSFSPRGEATVSAHREFALGRRPRIG